MGSISFAYGTQLLGTTTLYPDAGLQVRSLMDLTVSVVTDVALRAERRKDRVCSDTNTGSRLRDWNSCHGRLNI